MMLPKNLLLSRIRSRDNKLAQYSLSRIKSTLLLFIIFVSSITTLPILQSTSVGAATTSDSKGASAIDWQIKSLIYYKSITECMKYTALTDSAAGLDFWNGYNNRINQSNANSGKWFASGLTQAIGVYMKGTTNLKVDQSGLIDCSNPSLISGALSIWDLKPIDVLCNSGFQRADIDNPTPENCLSGTTNFKLSGSQSESATKFATYIKAQVYNSQEPKLTPVQLYIFYRHSLNQSCISNIDTTAPVIDANYTNGYSNVQWVGNTPTELITGSYPPGSSLKSNSRVTVRPWVNAENGDTSVPPYNGDFTGTWETCSNLVKLMSNNAGAYLAWANIHPDEAGKITTAATDPKNNTSSATCGDKVPGMGWILCPIINGLTGLNDAMWGLVSSLLNVNPINQSDAIYNAWGTIRNLANVVFVIIFLIMIFSQLSSVGITNYGVKKLLPRLIVGAILVNLSFIIIQISVDLANIMGSSLYGLLAGLAPNAQPTWTTLLNLITQGATAASLGAIGIALAGGGAAAFWMLLPMLAMGALGLLAAVLTLIFRQAVIPVLAILAPLAFIAYLLPNTESWFKKWRDLFLTMLMLYPLAALVFGGAQFAAGVIIGDGTDWWNLLIGLIMLTLPLFSLPFLVTKSGALVGKVGGILNGIANKAKAPISRVAKSHQELAQEKYMGTPAGKYNFGKRARLAMSRGTQRRKLQTEAYKKQQDDMFAQDLKGNTESYLSGVGAQDTAARSYIQGTVARIEARDLSEAMQSLDKEVAQERVSGRNTDDFLRGRATNTNATEIQRKAAYYSLAALGRDGVLRTMRDNPVAGEDNDTRTARLNLIQEAITANAGKLSDKAPDLVKNSNDVAFNHVTGNDLAGFSTGTAAAYMRHLENLHTTATAPTATPDQIRTRDEAVNAFNSAVEDITRTPALQSKFGDDVGRTIQSTISSSSAGFQTYATGPAGTMIGLAAIQTDGKIR